jgi:hypothetical protein
MHEDHGFPWIMRGSVMRVNAAPFRVSLRWGTPLTVADGEGTCITARRGTVWITQDNDLRDVVLASGESFRLDHPELAIVQAFDNAEVLVVPPAESTRAGPRTGWPTWLARVLAWGRAQPLSRQTRSKWIAAH